MLLSIKGKKAQATGCFRIVISRTGDPSRENLFCGFMGAVCLSLQFTFNKILISHNDSWNWENHTQVPCSLCFTLPLTCHAVHMWLMNCYAAFLISHTSSLE
jgi:hypothetical protein